MKIKLIAAVGKNYEIGKDNKLIFPIKEDLIFFRNVTIYHNVLMGRKTFKSIGKVLPNRNNIVLTRQNIDYDRVIVYSSKEDFIKDYIEKDEDVFIIGGESIYKQFIDLADEIYLTEIDKEKEDADAYFPYFDKELFKKEELSSLSENDINYKHVLYRRLK